MEHIITPGRIKYIRGGKVEGCIFCKDSIREDDLVLHEGETSYIVMNKYPYTTGHVMIVPYRHICELKEMTPDEKLEMMNLLIMTIGALKRELNPEGFNVGMNLGRAAGAGVECHLHLHVVPRWVGDTNFATVLGDVRIIPEDIETTRKILLASFGKCT